MKPQTYAETSGEQPFDWNQWLDDAKFKEPSRDEWRDVTARAESWVTCAVGNECRAIPRCTYGTPIDDTLENLGIDFADAIRGGEWGMAKIVMGAIEDRSFFLLAQMEAAK